MDRYHRPLRRPGGFGGSRRVQGGVSDHADARVSLQRRPRPRGDPGARGLGRVVGEVERRPELVYTGEMMIGAMDDLRASFRPPDRCRGRARSRSPTTPAGRPTSRSGSWRSGPGTWSSTTAPTRRAPTRGTPAATGTCGSWPTDGVDDAAAALAQRIDADTVAVCVTHVAPFTGRRHDLRAIADAAHAHGAMLLVDAAQSTGIVPIDVTRDGVDALVTTAMKWLLGPPGIGFLYLSPELLADAPTLDVGYLGLDAPLGEWPPNAMPAGDGRRPPVRARTPEPARGLCRPRRHRPAPRGRHRPPLRACRGAGHAVHRRPHRAWRRCGDPAGSRRSAPALWSPGIPTCSACLTSAASGASTSARSVASASTLPVSTPRPTSTASSPATTRSRVRRRAPG